MLAERVGARALLELLGAVGVVNEHVQAQGLAAAAAVQSWMEMAFARVL